MGYFDGLTASSFKTDEKGNTIFYPWGTFGAGYILPEDKRDDFRIKIKRHLMIFVPLSILSTILFKIWAILVFPIYLLAYGFWIKIQTRGLAVSTEKLTLSASIKNSAHSHNLTTLWFLEVGALLFVIAGIVILVNKPEKWLGAWLGIVFFGWCAYIIWKMIKAKTSHEA